MAVLMYNREKKISDRIEVKISYLTALLFIDGEHASSYYPQGLSETILKECVSDDLRDNGLNPEKEDVETIVRFAKLAK